MDKILPEQDKKELENKFDQLVEQLTEVSSELYQKPEEEEITEETIERETGIIIKDEDIIRWKLNGRDN